MIHRQGKERRVRRGGGCPERSWGHAAQNLRRLASAGAAGLTAFAMAGLGLPSTALAAGMPGTSGAAGGPVIAVGADGTVPQDTAPAGDGPRITKVRVLQEGDFLEVYWNEYVDETQAINPDNFVLRNGGSVIPLKAKPAAGLTDTLYFDRDNREIKATDAQCFNDLDPDLHLSSIAFDGTIDPSKPTTLEVHGSAITDADGNAAADETFTAVPKVSFYTQQLVTKSGIVVKADDTVKPTTLQAAGAQIDVELGKPGTGIPEAMVASHNMFAIYSAHEVVYQIPEQRYNFDKTLYNVEGLGGVPTRDGYSASISEKNVLRTLSDPDDPAQVTGYRNENILIHEFGHSVKIGGLDQMKDQTLADAFYRAYAHARKAGLWPRTYAIQDSDEFFATMAAIWFNVMEEGPRQGDPYDGVRGPINTRAEMKTYDPMTYDAMSRIFPDTFLPAPWDTYVDSRHDGKVEPPTDDTGTSTSNDLTSDLFQITSDWRQTRGDYYYVEHVKTLKGGGLDLYSLWGAFNDVADTSGSWKLTRTADGIYTFESAGDGGLSHLGLTADDQGRVSVEGHPYDASDPAQQWRFIEDTSTPSPYDGHLVNVKYGKALGVPTTPYSYSLLTLRDVKDAMPWQLRNVTASRRQQVVDGLYMLPDRAPAPSPTPGGEGGQGSGATPTGPGASGTTPTASGTHLSVPEQKETRTLGRTGVAATSLAAVALLLAGCGIALLRRRAR